MQKAKLLIVDDESSIQTSLSQTFTELGYSVRSAKDGFAALSEIRNEIPDILLSDLNMPGMSGFELLSVIRRRFPAVWMIAMSGAFSGRSVPPGVVADAFYEKGSSPVSLLEIVEVMANVERSTPQHPNILAPIWVPKNGHDPSGAEYVTIVCPECLRTFPRTLGEASLPVHETACVYCSSLIHYAIVQAFEPSPQALQRKPGTGMPVPFGIPDLSQ